MSYLPIEPDAVPLRNRSPYRRIDASNPGRKQRITSEDWLLAIERGDRLPDLALYEYDASENVLILRERFR